MEREIIIVSTKDVKINRLTTDATNWGQLKEIISSKYDLSNLTASVSTTKVTLEHDEAVLPTEPFKLYLKAKDSKGGANYSEMSFGALNALFTQEDKDAASVMFEMPFSILRKAELIEFLNSRESDETNILVDDETNILVDDETNILVDEEGLVNIPVKASGELELLSPGTDIIEHMEDFSQNIQGMFIEAFTRGEFVINNEEDSNEEIKEEILHKLCTLVDEINNFISFTKRVGLSTKLSVISEEEIEMIKEEMEQHFEGFNN